MVIDYYDYYDEMELIESLKNFYSYDKEQVNQILRYINNIENDGKTDLENIIIWIFKTDTFKIFNYDREYIRKLCNTLMLTALITIDGDSCFIITPLGVTYLLSH